MLDVDGLSVMRGDGGLLLKSVTLRLTRGEAVGLTGESGAGKSTLLKAIMGTLDPGCRICAGSLVLRTEEDRPRIRLEQLSAKRRRSLAGTTIGYIPQHPLSAFDSRLTIGAQMEETFRVKLELGKTAARHLAADMLRQAGLGDAPRVMRSLPEGLSGGMLQRVAIAMLLGLSPAYILADEPTASLDADNRAHVLALLKQRLGSSGLLLVSHDVQAMRLLCGTVAVLYDGEMAECGPVEQLLRHPAHAWTRSFANRCRAAYGGNPWPDNADKGGDDGWRWELYGQNM